MNLRKNLAEDKIEMIDSKKQRQLAKKELIQKKVKDLKQQTKNIQKNIVIERTRELFYNDKLEELQDENQTLRMQKIALTAEYHNQHESHTNFEKKLPPLKIGNRQSGRKSTRKRPKAPKVDAHQEIETNNMSIGSLEHDVSI